MKILEKTVLELYHPYDRAGYMYRKLFNLMKKY